jgi:TonB family protein
MNLLRVLFNDLSKELSDRTNDFYIALSVSVVIHLFVFYCVFFIPSNRPLKMESITVDFAMIKAEKMSGKENAGVRREGGKGEGERKAPQVIGVKAAGNEVRSMDNPGDNKNFTANNTGETDNKDKNNISTDIVSLNAFKSNHNEYGSRTGTGSAKAGRIGTGSSGSAEGTDGGGPGLSGEGGEGKAYDYGYVRDAVMKNLKYPEKARRFGWEGKVVLYFVINETGLVRDVKIVKSSGIQMLDEAAKEALGRVVSFRNKYNRLVVVQLPIEFRLKQ